MESNTQLVLSVPQGSITATRLGIDGLAWHRSPGSGKHFHGRSILVDLALTADGLKPDFDFLDEGGWRDAKGDAVSALAAAVAGKRTKTALSNNAFSCTPVSAYRRMFLVKTGGQTLELAQGKRLAEFPEAQIREGMSPDEIAKTLGFAPPVRRVPRAYMVLCPIEFVVLSNLTPEEYVWYATHRPGKKFRQVLFTEIRAEDAQLAADSVYEEARRELLEAASKKTKTIITSQAINRVPWQSWVGYHHDFRGGVYAGDEKSITLWPFPERVPAIWERAAG